ncbi:tyrosyl-tRNA synthetase, variant 2 [Entomophthora muscae]|uniref:Tyrosyl-tRNA synthetase, variant 2 n=1 Tax=Entomophthora muscae TaxID=34485 RepID=A0ACC2T6U8_9FUNG|nr:tyrosyl-tRNA synthetase, variant 2 [Entomophthora muscae]
MGSLASMLKWSCKARGRIAAGTFHSVGHYSSKGTPTVIPGLYEDLKCRQLISQSTSEKLGEFLSTESRTVYCGFDPTASSLHLGHLFSLVTLLRFRQYGHGIIALIGGATGTIGDPSGKNTERPLLEPEKLNANQKSLEDQISNFFERAVSHLNLRQTPTLVLNNIEWLGKISALEFFTLTGRHARLSTMLAKDSVKGRLDSPQGLSFTEFSYQLFQAHDFWHLHQNYDCQLQVGGQDQWGNILAGIDLIHKRRSNPKDAFGFTTPLLTTSSGEKIGKSAGNALWLDPKLTSPFQFYQYFMKIPDAELQRLFLSFTFVEPEAVHKILKAHNETPEALDGQRRLAQEVTSLVHGGILIISLMFKVLVDSLASAEAITSALFSDPQKLQTMSASELELAFGLKNAPSDLVVALPKDAIINQPIVNVVCASGLTKSKG